MILDKRTAKYLLSALLAAFAAPLVFGITAARPFAGPFSNDSLRRAVAAALADPETDPEAETAGPAALCRQPAGEERPAAPEGIAREKGAAGGENTADAKRRPAKAEAAGETERTAGVERLAVLRGRTDTLQRPAPDLPASRRDLRRDTSDVRTAAPAPARRGIRPAAGSEVRPAIASGPRDTRRNARRSRRNAAETSAAPPAAPTDTLPTDTLRRSPAGADSLAADTLRRDTVRKPRAPKKLIEDPISGKNTDSLVYDVRNKLVYIYNEGDISYQTSNLKADFMRIDLNTKLVYAYGKQADSLGLDGKPIATKPEYTEGEESYRMDTITYHLDTKKAKIKGVATQQGDGWLVGGSVKKMTDNTINIENGKYTTCDNTDHPHFYLAMTKAKVIPGKKVVTGPAYLVF